MAVTRYAGDRFVIGGSDNEPTGVLDGAYLINTGDLAQKVLRNGSWVALSGAGGGGSANPGTPLNSVQFNSSSTFAGNANLTFTDGNRLNVNKLGISGNVYDSNNSLGEGGMVLTNEGQTGVNWKSIESVLSGVGGSGVTNYVARWSDEDTLTTGSIYDNASKVGISTASPQAELHIYAGTIGGDHLLVESTNTAAGDAPDLVLYRNSPSPANGDDLGILRFRGKNDGTDTGFGENKVIYADIEAEITSVVSGAEGATLKFYTQDNGSSAARMVITGSNVGIGTVSPYRKLHINGDAIISGKFYDVTNSTGDKGYVLTSDDNGPVWAASGNFDGLSGNLVATGAIIDGISGNLITTGQTLTSEINTVSGNLIATGAIVDDISGNLITTGQTLTNNLIATGAIVDSVSGNLITTGQTLTTNINTVATNLIATGAVIDGVSGNLITTGQTLTTNINTVATNLIASGAVIDDVSGNLIQTGQYLTDEIAIVSGLATGGSAGDFTALSGALIATGAIIDDVSGNLITTGQTLTTNINTVSTNLVATGAIVDDISGNLITTGQTLTTNINTVSTNLIATGAIVDDISGNLITTGQTLTNEIAIVSGLVATGAIDGSGVANYVARWSDEDTITSGVIQDNGTAVGINQAADPNNALTIKSIENNSNPLQIAAHDGDSLFVFHQTAGDARLSLKKDGGVEEIRLESDADSWIKGGNLGIGTVGAGAKLESYISATGEKGLRLNSNFAGGNTVDFIPAIVGISNAGFSIDLAGTNRLVINSDGNVGIGTNAPAAKLDLRSSDSVVAYIIRPSDSPTLHIGSATSAGARIGYIHTNDYAFFGHDADHDAIVVNSNGNVGVGTTNPGSRLETSGTFRSTHPGTSPTAGVGIEVLYKPLDELGYIYTYDRDSNVYKTTRIGSDTYFTADGNVGFGTAIAEHDLHVNGSAIISGKLYDQTNSTGDKGYVLTSDDNGPLWKASGDFDGLSGNLVATGAIVDDISGNLITTGQTLQTQITANDGDISTLTTNLITTGQTLTSEIAIVSGLATGGSAEDFTALSGALIATGAIIDDVSGNLITTGQTLQTQITSNDADITTLTSNLITTGQTLTSNINGLAGNVGVTGQTLQSQITANDGDISTLTTNLITTGQTLTSEIGIVSGLTVTNANNLVSTGAIVDDISGNLITTGQTLTSEIATVSGLVSTGALDGSGVANYSAKWLDGNTVTSGVIYDDGDVGISTSSPDAKLHVFDSTVADLAIFETNNPNSSNGPDVVLYRSSASPADADDLGRIAFRGRNDADQDINYANVIGEAIDVSDGNEDGALRFNTYLTGVSTETMVLRSANVGIGTATPAELLEISATGDAAMQFQSTATSLSGGETIGAIKFKNNDSSGTDPHICGTIASIAETQYGRAGLAFSTGRTSEFAERMRIRYDGNVGIGIDAPVAKLHVSNSASSGGTFKFTDGSSRTLMDLGGGVLSWNAASVLGAGAWAGTADHEIKTLTTTRDTVLIVGPSSGTNHALYVTGLKSYFAGSVGIGTDVPATDLEVYKSSGAVQIYANSNSIIARLAVTGAGLGAVGTSSNADFVIQRNGTTKITVASALTTMVGEVLITTGSTSVRTLSGVLKADTIENNSGASNLKLQTESGGNKHIEITPDGTGNVGIGIATPAAKLNVVLDSSDTNTPTDVLRLGHTSTGSTAVGFGALIRFDGERTGSTVDGMGRLGFVADVMTASRVDGAFIVQTGADGTYTERMRITSTGNVGIGTATPEFKLQVENTVAAGSDNFILNVRNTTHASDSRAGIAFRMNNNTGSNWDGAGIQATNDGVSGAGHLTFGGVEDSAFTERVRIQVDGKVGIGTNVPAERLHVYKSGTDTPLRVETTGHVGVELKGGTSHDIYFLLADTSTNAKIGWDHSATALKFNASASFSDNHLVVKSTGVGIGTDAPSYLLHTYGATADQLLLERSNANDVELVIKNSEQSWVQGIDRSESNHYAICTGDSVATNKKIVIQTGGKIQFNTYGGGTHTGTLAKSLGVDSSGNVIEFTGGGGTVDGSGTANYVAKWSGSGTIANSVLRDDGNRLAVGAAPSSAAGILHLKDVSSNQAKMTLESANAYNSWINFSAASDEMSIGYDKSTVGGFVFANADALNSNIRMVILSAGSVGIGTVSPSTKFQVHNGDILITSGKQLISTNSYTQAPPAMLTTQGPSTGATTLGTGTWGIMMGPQHTRSTTANTYYPGIAFNHLLNNGGVVTYNNHPQAWIGTRLHDTPGSERAFLVFSTKGGTGVTASDVPLERMCIDPVDGNVGIGTTDPSTILEVGGDADVYGLIGRAKMGTMGHADYAGFSHRDMGGTGNYGLLQSPAGATFLNAASGQTIYFRVNNADTMYMTSTQLQFNDSKKLILGNDSDLQLYHDGSNSYIKDAGTGSLLIEVAGTGDSGFYKVGGEKLATFEPDGPVTLYHNNSKKLETTSGGVTVTGTLTETSSITLKENVETYTPSLDIINKIRPVKYNRKTNKDKKEIGLIAEELAELFPELVEKDGKGNPSSVNYSRAVTVLLGGFKELYKEIEELKKRI